MNSISEERPIKGYEGYYTVTANGDVFSLPRFCTGTVKRKLKHAPRPNGYWFVTLSVGNKPKSISVHKLVALNFLGQQPTPKHQVNHKDGNKDNNHKSNLEWLTCSENVMHAVRTGLTKKGEDSYKASITEKQAKKIIELYYRGRRQVDIASIVGTNKHVVHFIIKGKSWKYLPRPSF